MRGLFDIYKNKHSFVEFIHDKILKSSIGMAFTYKQIAGDKIRRECKAVMNQLQENPSNTTPENKLFAHMKDFIMSCRWRFFLESTIIQWAITYIHWCEILYAHCVFLDSYHWSQSAVLSKHGPLVRFMLIGRSKTSIKMIFNLPFLSYLRTAPLLYDWG